MDDEIKQAKEILKKQNNHFIMQAALIKVQQEQLAKHQLEALQLSTNILSEKTKMIRDEKNQKFAVVFNVGPKKAPKQNNNTALNGFREATGINKFNRDMDAKSNEINKSLGLKQK
jgi:hypothetical protein